MSQKLLRLMNNFLKLTIIEVLYFFKTISGNILSQLGRKEEAIIDYTKAIEINVYYADAYTNRG